MDKGSSKSRSIVSIYAIHCSGVNVQQPAVPIFPRSRLSSGARGALRAGVSPLLPQSRPAAFSNRPTSTRLVSDSNHPL